MANRMLTFDDIQRLFREALSDEDIKDGPYLLDAAPPYRIVHHPSTKFIEFTTHDLILSDRDFKDYRIIPFLRHTRSAPTKEMSLLDQRGKTHGDYAKMSAIIQDLKAVARRGTNWATMSAGKREAVELMATKLGRILEGDPDFVDHWDDIAGYANKGKG